jgi:hypothetical protein
MYKIGLGLECHYYYNHKFASKKHSHHYIS